MDDKTVSQDPRAALQAFKQDILETARRLHLPDRAGLLSSGIDAREPKPDRDTLA